MFLLKALELRVAEIDEIFATMFCTGFKIQPLVDDLSGGLRRVGLH
jgi:hypothetical protein